MSWRRLRLVIFGLVPTVAACGLRSSSDAVLLCSEEGDADTGGELRSGSCANPIDLPFFTALTVRGRLGGCSESSGWCSTDAGPEDVYRLGGQPNPFDVVIGFDAAETTFSPTLRVVHDDGTDAGFDPCDAPPVSKTEVCGPEADSRNAWSFNAVSGDYYLIVDSASPTAGLEYAFDIAYGLGAVPTDCPLMSDTIALGNGGVYAWQDTLPRDQGVLDGHCNAPGAEHTWTLQLKNAGLLQATVEGQGGLEPVLSVRTSCAGNSELFCDNSTSSSGTAKLSEFLEAGVYRLTVDQQSVTGGEYSLTVALN